MEQQSYTIQTPPTQMHPASTPPPIEHSHHIGRIVGMMLALGVLLVAGGVGAYMYMQRVPAQLLERSFVAMGDVQTYRMNFESIIHSTPPAKEANDDATAILFALGPQEPQDIFIRVVGAVDTSNEESTNVDLDVDLSLTELGSQNTQEVSLHMKANKEVYYLNVTDMPSLGLFDLSAFMNKWIMLDLRQEAGDTISPLGELTESMTKKLDEYLPTKEEQAKREQIEARTKELLVQYPLFPVVKTYARTSMNGVSVYHVAFAFDTESAKTIIMTLDAEFGDGTEDSRELIQNIVSLLQELRSFDGEAWIGVEDLLLYQLKTNMDYVSEERGAVTVESQLILSQHNQPVTVVEPTENVVSARELFADVFGSMMGERSSIMTFEDTTDTDGDGLSDTKELWLGLDPENIDSDGDGMLDAEDEEYNGDGYSFPIDLEFDPSATSDLGMYEFDVTDESILSETEGMDTDGDGLSDSMEALLGSDPENPDTDGDGYTDGEEVDNGYSPIN